MIVHGFSNGARLAGLVLCAGLVAPVAACTRTDGHAHGREPVLTVIEHAGDAPIPAVSARPSANNRDLVEARAPSTVAPFFVLARTSQLTKAPCANCHPVPASAVRSPSTADTRRAHWSIALEHASGDVMACATCHTAGTPDALRTLTGAAVSLDHAYQVCAQCHSGQAADWAGGAHGKRAGGWAPPRIVYSCTECHDPHRPALASRWPARAGRAFREAGR